MMGTSRDVLCVYIVLMQNLLLCLIFKLKHEDHKGNNVFYQHAANLERLKCSPIGFHYEQIDGMEKLLKGGESSL